MTDSHNAARQALLSVVSERRCLRSSVIATVLLALGATHVFAQAPEEHSADAPADMTILGHTRGGVYYIAKPLKEKRDQLHAELRRLSSDIDDATVNREEAEKRLAELTTRIETLELEIETQKVLAAPVTEHRIEEKIQFELGSERLLVITADDVTIVGWDRPHVDCTLTKIILAPKDADVASDAAGLKLVQKRGVFPDLVGRTDEQAAADEQKFLDSEDGKKLTPEQRTNWLKFSREISDSWKPYQRFQGREIDTVEIAGLTWEQGNRQVTLRTASKNGSGTVGSTWKRHASLTVHVPKAQAILLRGCRVNLDASQVQADLHITASGSQDIGYDGSFRIRDHIGSLRIDAVPVQSIENVKGDVDVSARLETSNTGTSSQDDWRLAYSLDPATLAIRGIDGHVHGRFLRSDVTVSEVRGDIDIDNDFGNTSIKLTGPLKATSQKVMSEAGRITVTLNEDVLKSLPIYAITDSGSVRTNTSRQQMDDFNVGGGSTDGKIRFHVRGFTTKNSAQVMDALSELATRFTALRTGEPREPGLDLYSRGGSVIVEVQE